MGKTIGMAKARENFAELVNQVAFGGQRYVVERRGKPLVALIGSDEYHELIRLLEETGVSDQVRGIPVRVRFDGERYFIADDRFDLYGVGRTLDEAREDYWLAVQDYYDDLSANADSLARYMQEHLVLLRHILSEDVA